MENNEDKIKETAPVSKPNDIGGFYFSSMIKITDPENKQVLLQQRGDE